MITTQQAVTRRLKSLMYEKNMKPADLERRSNIQHGHMEDILRRNKDYKLTTLYKLAKGLNMTLIEFLDCAYLKDDNVLFDNNKKWWL